MSETQNEEIVRQMVEQANVQSRDLTDAIKALSPDLEWEKMENLVGEKILVIEVQEGYSQFSDDALQVTFAKEDGTAWRVTSIYNVVNRKLRKLADQLPGWCVVTQHETKDKLRQY